LVGFDFAAGAATGALAIAGFGEDGWTATGVGGTGADSRVGGLSAAGIASPTTFGAGGSSGTGGAGASGAGGASIGAGVRVALESGFGPAAHAAINSTHATTDALAGDMIFPLEINGKSGAGRAIDAAIRNAAQSGCSGLRRKTKEVKKSRETGCIPAQAGVPTRGSTLAFGLASAPAYGENRFSNRNRDFA
jgi:hypothetical protein